MFHAAAGRDGEPTGRVGYRHRTRDTPAHVGKMWASGAVAPIGAPTARVAHTRLAHALMAPASPWPGAKASVVFVSRACITRLGWRALGSHRRHRVDQLQRLLVVVAQRDTEQLPLRSPRQRVMTRVLPLAVAPRARKSRRRQRGHRPRRGCPPPTSFDWHSRALELLLERLVRHRWGELQGLRQRPL